MKNNIESFIQSFEFIDELVTVNVNFEIQSFSEISDICEFVGSKIREEKKKLPYHINIVDLLGANENAHSRVLERLLKQCNNNRFEILESLLEYISESNEGFKLNINRPFITVEKDRIDVLVRDDNYAIIFENKIHGAVDQVSQLSRYIEKVGKMGYRKEQIYIIYLSRDDGKSPSDHSWGTYKEMFENRYMRLTYRDYILPWLQDIVLPNIRGKDIYLKSCIEQYIDHLEGLFSLRKIQINMNEKLEEIISNKLGLTDSPEKNYSILSEKMNEINNVRDQIAILRSKAEMSCWEEWIKRLKIDFPNLELMNRIEDKRYPEAGVKIGWGNKHFAVLIEKEVNSNTIYYGIGRHYSSEVIDNEIKGYLAPVLDGFKNSHWWYGYKYTSFEDGYKDLSNFIREVLHHIQKGN